MRKGDCLVCKHPKVLEIDKDYLSGKYVITALARKYGLTRSPMYRHCYKHIPQRMAELAEKRNLDNAQKVMDRLIERTAEVEKLLVACDEYLKDPDDPEKYTLIPRAEEVQVVYIDRDYDGNQIRCKAQLSQLLESLGNKVLSWQYRHADPRRLILEAARTLEGVLLTLSKIAGYVKPADKITNVQVNIVAMLPNVMMTLNKFPEAKQAVLKTLEKARAIKDANAGDH